MNKTYDVPVKIEVESKWTPEKMALADEVLELLNKIDGGRVEIEPSGERDVSHPTWKTENGWTLHVFDDCGEWDYLDEAISPDGRSIGFNELWPPESEWASNPMPHQLANWRPESVNIWWHPKWGEWINADHPFVRPPRGK